MTPPRGHCGGRRRGDGGGRGRGDRGGAARGRGGGGRGRGRGESSMATQAGRAIQDQNLNDVALLGVKTSFPKAEKNGRFSGRKALNDISNSGRPSSLQTAKKQSCNHLEGEKRSVSKAETGKAGGRKALGDLTNYGKQPVHQASKKTQDKKLSAVAEDQILPDNVLEEGFLHDHQKCVKARQECVIAEWKYLLENLGISVLNQVKLKLESPESPQSPESPPFKWKYEWPELEFIKRKYERPEPEFIKWEWPDPEFRLKEIPKLRKH